MSEPKFTPGPWLFSSYKSGNSVIVIDGKEFDVATVNYPNRDANAHLIAASPAMYAALEDCVELLKSLRGTTANEEGAIDHQVAEAEEALRLARGEE